MAAEGAFTWGALMTPVGDFMTETLHVDPHVCIDLSIVAIVLLVLAYFGGRKFRSSDSADPPDKLDFSSAVEVIVGGVYSFAKGQIGDRAKSLFFYLGTLTFFILFNNLVGLIPGFNPPTDQVNVTVVLGASAFLAYNLVGLKVHGPGYIKHFMGPLLVLAPLMLIIEFISHLVRPVSLSLRLFGNITGDHQVGAKFFDLIPMIVPLPFMGLGLFVSFVQTFVFVLLTLIYIQGAQEHAH